MPSRAVHPLRTLRDLHALRPVYVLPEDDFLGEVVIPSLSVAERHDCSSAIFHSAALREMAPGLSEFLARPDGRVRLLISPHLTPDDHATLVSGLNEDPQHLAQRLAELTGSVELTQSALARHTLACLAYLIACDRIEFKVVLVNKGLFHPKIRIYCDAMDDVLVAHGSGNFTAPGMVHNIEQITISRSWVSEQDGEVIERLQGHFDQLWQGRSGDYASVYDLPTAVRDRILRTFLPTDLPTPESYEAAWRQDVADELIPKRLSMGYAPREASAVHFSIPSDLVYDQGDFAHQGQAATAWQEGGGRGILEMATGSGKTVTSLIAAHRLRQASGSLLLVIAVPYIPLVSQWQREVERFGLRPRIPGRETTRTKKFNLVSGAIRNLRIGASDVECLVVTHDLLTDPEFAARAQDLRGPAMLIADEVHGLGTPRFLNAPPTFFEYRLGLSATPERQYDEVGTLALLEFFGPVVYRFTLEQAIGRCLVPYLYYLHPVELTEAEVDEWQRLTVQLRRLGWRPPADGPEPDRLPDRVERLLRQRRKILEQAHGKVAALGTLLRRENLPELQHTLVYLSDKGRAQITDVNRLLMDDLGLKIHQITQEETADRRLLDELLSRFSEGDVIQVLTAMRVLDEGVDIPEVSSAYILASTTVERQWVQRRGRVLRKCPSIGKEVARIHDFIVVPPRETGTGRIDPETRTIVGSELRRAMAFARLALNDRSPDGGHAVVSALIQEYF